jgi:hypothetical protein
MVMRVAQYTVWIEETGTADMRAVDAFQAIPGYLEHEWIDSQEED